MPSDPRPWLETVSGPDFLGFYVFWFFVCWLGLLFLRKAGVDRPLTTLVMFGLFEGLGIARYVAGSAAGMQRWGILFVMMFVGAFFFFLRAKSMSGSDSSSGNSWFSSSCSTSGGGCGSSGGGGGGCGGCGGGGD